MTIGKFLTIFKFAFKWFWNIFKKAIEYLIGKVCSKGVKAVLLKICIGIMCSSTVIAYIGYSINHWGEERKVHQLQDEIKTIEEKFAELKTYPKFYDNWVENEIVYKDKDTGEQIAIDVWEEGRLRFRKYYRQKSLIARDIFHYQDIQPIGKTREHLEGSVVVLIDEFTPAGALKSKRYREKGDDKNCRNYLRDFRSPLPPSAFVIYR